MSKITRYVTNKVAAWQTRDEEGQGLVEYGLILALISVVCIAALTLIGTNINSKLGDVNTALSL